jgi:hypothetical protein
MIERSYIDLFPKFKLSKSKEKLEISIAERSLRLIRDQLKNKKNSVIIY